MKDKDSKLLEEAYAQLNEYVEPGGLASSLNDIDPKFIFMLHKFLANSIGEPFKQVFPIPSGFYGSLKRYIDNKV